MVGETNSVNTMQIPVESDHNQDDQAEYWSMYETLGSEREERDYRGEKIPESQLEKEAKENIRAFKAKKIGARGLDLSQFEQAA